MSAWGTSWDKVVKPMQEQAEEVKDWSTGKAIAERQASAGVIDWPEEKLADAAIAIIGTVWPIPKEPTSIGWDLSKGPDQTAYGIIEDSKVRPASATEINAIYQASRVKNKVPTHDPYTNPGAYLYYECKCGQILDPKVKSFAALNNVASVVGWKIRFGHEYYIPYCIECGKGID